MPWKVYMMIKPGLAYVTSNSGTPGVFCIGANIIAGLGQARIRIPAFNSIQVGFGQIGHGFFV
jgi:hypothetical protein